MTNISTSRGNLYNLVWQASEDSSLVYIYANQDPKIFTEQDFILKTRQSSTSLPIDRNKGVQHIHLVIPRSDTISMKVVTMPEK